MKTSFGEKILGLDLGPNSIGWAIIDKQTDSADISGAGVRIFPAGLDDMEKDGIGKSRNMARREARGVRRNLDRRARRIAKLAAALSRAGLFPEGNLYQSVERHLMLNELDVELDNPYLLRARALDESLALYEVGRALFHLAQRRGFLSNRKAQPKDDDERGKVKAGIGELWRAIDESGSRTLGEYFSRINPREQKIRGRYTQRKMYEDEFNHIWDSQQRYHPELLTEKLKSEIYHIIFDQRPLKSVAHLIGKCSLEPKRRRAPWSCMEAQRFRYLQKVNDLMIIDQSSGEIRNPTADERAKIIVLCETKENVTFATLKTGKQLGKNIGFNLEAGGEKQIPGNKIRARIIKSIGEDTWLSHSESEQCGILDDLNNIENEDTLVRRLTDVWGLDKEKAESLSQSYHPEAGYCSISRNALRNILPHLKGGMQLATAIITAYPERRKASDPVDALPSLSNLQDWSLRNPIVFRTLSEVRHVINTVIREYGKPDSIRVELAREVRQTAKQREATSKKNRANEKQRADARKRLADAGYAEPSDTDILKVILADECGWTCPYTGKKIEMRSLFGSAPEFDIEHIIPFDRCLDNSFMNKTLCDVHENRNVKKNQTPFEAYSRTDRWDEVKKRIKNFDGSAAYGKFKLFTMDNRAVSELISDFTARQLNDTRWASRWAKKYLGLLYGGVNSDGIDESGKRRIFSCSGDITGKLRQVWGLNGILGTENMKSRDDHRHHAVDAIVVALVENSAIKKLADAARRGASRNRLLDTVEPPDKDLRRRTESIIAGIIPSHRASRRVRGPMHRDTFYSLRKEKDGKQYGYVRKPLAALTPAEIKDKIVDARVEQAVKDKLAELDGGPAAFNDAKNHPALPDKNGKPHPIHRVTVRSHLEQVIPVGSGHRQRFMKSETNHHMALYEVLDDSGNTIKWDCEVVSLFEAYRRKRAGEPIVRREFGPQTKFLFSLGSRDIIELDCDGGIRRFFVVRTIPQLKQIYFVPICDARKKKEIGAMGLTALPDSLRLRNCKKVTVDVMGRVRDARD